MRENKQKGITLIALVITIIVLLILAGISLSMLSGNNGLLTKASQAKEKTGTAQYEERIRLAYSAALMEKLKKGDTSIVTKDELKAALAGEGIEVSEDDIKLESGNLEVDLGDNGTYTIGSNGEVSYKDGTYKGGTVADNGNGVSGSTPGNPDENGYFTENSTADGNASSSTNPTIPTGFKVSEVTGEDTVNNGLVIKNKAGDEFVWIPVPTAVSDTEENGTTNKAMAINIGTEATPIYRGLLYNFSGTSSTVQSGCTTTTDSYREPAYLTNSSYADASSYNKVGITEETLQNEYNKMIKSVKTYGGFFVGRYEMSLDENKKAIVQANKTPASAGSSSANTWYGLYAKAKEYGEGNSKYNSSMIWGSQYDAMLNFALTNETDKTKVTATGNGNHSSSVVNTGSTTTDKICNIFDLEGNMREWSLEANYTAHRVQRGGGCDYSNSPATRDFNNPFSTYTCSGSRLTLYL